MLVTQCNSKVSPSKQRSLRGNIFALDYKSRGIKAYAVKNWKNLVSPGSRNIVCDIGLIAGTSFQQV